MGIQVAMACFDFGQNLSQSDAGSGGFTALECDWVIVTALAFVVPEAISQVVVRSWNTGESVNC